MARNIVEVSIDRLHSCHSATLFFWELRVKDESGLCYVTRLYDRMGSNLLNYKEAQEAAEAHLDLNYQNWREACG